MHLWVVVLAGIPGIANVGLMGSACGGERAAPDGMTVSATALPSDLRTRIEAEVRAKLTPEIEAELRPKIAAEIRREFEERMRRDQALASAHRPANSATNATTNPGGDLPATHVPPHPGTPDPSVSDPAANDLPRPSTEPATADIWAHPGTHVWPMAGSPRLVELAVGTGLEDKTPRDVQEVYAKVPELLYCYSSFENSQSEQTITHVWRRGNRLVSRVELEVGQSPKWKTWSKQRTQPHWTGLWSCEVLGPDGAQLGLTVFRVGG